MQVPVVLFFGLSNIQGRGKGAHVQITFRVGIMVGIASFLCLQVLTHSCL